MDAYLGMLASLASSVHCNTDSLYQPEAFAIASNLSLLTMYIPTRWRWWTARERRTARGNRKRRRGRERKKNREGGSRRRERMKYVLSSVKTDLV